MRFALRNSRVGVIIALIFVLIATIFAVFNIVLGILALLVGMILTTLMVYTVFKRSLLWYAKYLASKMSDEKRAILMSLNREGKKNAVLKFKNTVRDGLIIPLIISLTINATGIVPVIVVHNLSNDNNALLSVITAKDTTDPTKSYLWNQQDLGDLFYQKTIDGITYNVTYEYDGDKLVATALNELNDTARPKTSQGGDGERYFKYWKFRDNWCASFVGYCIVKSGLADDGEVFDDFIKSSLGKGSMDLGGGGGPLSCTYDYYDYFTSGMGLSKANGTEFIDCRLVKPGDIVLYREGTDPENGHILFGHIGIIEKIEDNILYTIEGNCGGGGDPSYEYSKVKEVGIPLRSDGTAIDSSGRLVHVYRPPYKSTEKIVQAGQLVTFDGIFSLDSYEKTDDGYYKDPKQIIYDYSRLVLGLSSAASCALMANVQAECGYRYDMVESGWGTVYEFEHGQGRRFSVPRKSGNGNWKDFSDFEEAMQIAHKLWSKDGVRVGGETKYGYGMGFGVVQWSSGRKTAYYNYCKENNLPFCGPDCIVSQLSWMLEEMKNSYNGVYNKLSSSTVETLEECQELTGYITHKYEMPSGHSGENASFWSCKECSRRASEIAPKIWAKYGNTEPIMVSAEDKINAGTVSIKNTTVVGDKNIMYIKGLNLDLLIAKKIIAINDTGFTNYDTVTGEAPLSATESDKTLKETIQSLTEDDLKHIMIMLGTNDIGSSKEEFMSGVKSILDTIRSKCSASNVVICTIPKFSGSDTDIDNYNGYIKETIGKYTGLNIKLLDINVNLTDNDIAEIKDGVITKNIADKISKHMTNNCF